MWFLKRFDAGKQGRMFLLEMLKEVDWVDDFFAAIYDNFEFK